MLTAKKKSGEAFCLGGEYQKDELLQLRRSEQFYCPICGESVLLKLGDQRIFHFAHKNDRSCSGFFENETIYHMEGKLQLYQWIKDQNVPCELEYYDPIIKQRPDIMFTYNGHNYALEFQCSTISEELFIKRTTSYLQNGYIPLWIVSLPHIKTKRNQIISLTNFTYLFLQKTSNGIYQIPAYCPETKVFHLLHSILPYSIKNTFGKQGQFPLEKFKLQDLAAPQHRHYQVSPTKWMMELERYNQSWALHSGMHRNPFLCELYKQNLNLYLLPPELGLPVPQSFIFQTPPIIWQSYLFLDTIKNKDIGEIVTMKEVNAHVTKRIKRKEINIRNLPLLTEVNPLVPVMEYLQLLCKMDILTQKSHSTFIINNKIFVPKTNRERENAKQLFLEKKGRIL